MWTRSELGEVMESEKKRFRNDIRSEAKGSTEIKVRGSYNL